MPDIPITAARAWSAVLLVAAVALLVGGGAVDNFRPLPSGAVPADTPLPVLESPRGELPEPPRVFKWTPGGERDLSQVTLLRGNLTPLWRSAPTESSELHVDPAVVFAEIPAGGHLYWRVREVRDGKPRATSAVAEFWFVTHVRGQAEGKSAPMEPFLPSE
jgi:hypothetical protein